MQVTPTTFRFKKNKTGQNETIQNFAKVVTFQKPPILKVDVAKRGKTEWVLFHSVNVLTNVGGTLD
jgi:hypothetical protein